MATAGTATGSKSQRSILKLVYEIFFCTFSLVNVLFVLFDYTYLTGVPYSDITFRDVYLQKLPPLLEKIGVRGEYSTFVTDTYDPVKDIVPHRGTDRYLATVEFLSIFKKADEGKLTGYLESLISDPGLPDDQNDLRNDRRNTIARVLARRPGEANIPLGRFDDAANIRDDIQADPADIARLLLEYPDQVEKKTLAYLRGLSVEMINDSPFDIARKHGTLEVIKKRIRNRIKRKLKDDPAEQARIGGSAKKSFDYFWRMETDGGLLNAENYDAELAWFAANLRPLMEQNFFRHLGDDGELVNNFYRIDLYFVAFFWIDFLGRWILALFERRYRKWYLFPVTRGFEVFNLLLPHHSAWLRLGRIIPLFVRLRENGFIPGEGIMPSLVHDNAAIIAEEISGLVLVRILAQMQTLLRGADLAAISKKGDAAMIEVQALLDSQTEVLAHGMVPVIQPQIADLVQHSIDKALEPWLFSPIGGLLRIGMIQVHKSVRDGLEAGLASDEAREQLTAILQKSTDAIIAEMTEPDNLRVLQQNLDRVLGSVIEDLQISLQKQEAREVRENGD